MTSMTPTAGCCSRSGSKVGVLLGRLERSGGSRFQRLSPAASAWGAAACSDSFTWMRMP